MTRSAFPHRLAQSILLAVLVASVLTACRGQENQSRYAKAEFYNKAGAIYQAYDRCRMEGGERCDGDFRKRMTDACETLDREYPDIPLPCLRLQ